MNYELNLKFTCMLQKAQIKLLLFMESIGDVKNMKNKEKMENRISKEYFKWKDEKISQVS